MKKVAANNAMAVTAIDTILNPASKVVSSSLKRK